MDATTKRFHTTVSLIISFTLPLLVICGQQPRATTKECDEFVKEFMVRHMDPSTLDGHHNMRLSPSLNGS